MSSYGRPEAPALSDSRGDAVPMASPTPTAIETATLFHGIVWTERAVRAVTERTELLESLTEPLWSPYVKELLLTTSPRQARAEHVTLPTGRKPLVVIGPDTDPSDDLQSLDFEKYCSKTLAHGISALAGTPDVIPHRLGVFAPASDSVRLYEAKNKVQSAVLSDGSQFVEWDVLREGDLCFCGPSFFQLARKRLVLAGVDPRRTLWIVAADDDQNAEVSTLDAAIAARHANLVDHDAPQALCINVGGSALPARYPWLRPPTRVRTVIDLVALDRRDERGGAAQEEASELIDQRQDALDVVHQLRTTGPISLHPRCEILLYRERVYDRLRAHRDQATSNLDYAKSEYCRAVKNCLPWSGEPATDQQLADLFTDDHVFDHRSGAICFDAYEWSLDVVPKKLQGGFHAAMEYFRASLETQWQRERPNHQRILATPTKYLLRGEDYYTNLRNEPPLKRMSQISDSAGKAFDVLPPVGTIATNVMEWKLALGVLDQLRNAALQFAWFQESLRHLKDVPYEEPKHFRLRVRECLDAVTGAYYRYLFGQSDALAVLRGHADKWDAVRRDVVNLASSIAVGVDSPEAQRFEWNLLTSKVIRRWREADHPGENAFVALAAANPDEAPAPAIGIGWGGVEMPIAYRHIMEIVGRGPQQVFAAHYSKYARAGARKPHIVDLSPGADKESLRNSRYLIFDDNSLSGATLQVVIEHLWHEYGARPHRALISRFSGERRYDQMRMEKDKRGGLLDPDLLKDRLVAGYVGETPFSRSWSRDVYQNPIGVFSLAKRRILELLHSNSSADRFDREGF